VTVAATDPGAAVAVALFGVRFGGIDLALPGDMPLVFLDRAVVHPLAGAPAAVAGLTQLQGHPVVVLEAEPLALLPAIRRCAVLVIGAPGQGAGLRVDRAPVAITVDESSRTRSANPPACSFGAVLRAPLRDAADPQRLWWTFEAPALFRLLGTLEAI